MRLAILPFITILFLSSCATYTMTPEQLIVQLKRARPDTVGVRGGGLLLSVDRDYKINGIGDIVCQDKNGKTISITNNPNVECRITDKKNKRHLFYFDTINLEDSVIKGCNSRFLHTMKSVKIADIQKVELQDAKKAFSYN
jgi:hypothetical protein